MNNEFDFLCDVILHVGEVSEALEEVASELRKRGMAHDRTKFQELEFDAFVSTRDKFKKANYGSKEYQECIDAVKPAVDHHYANNRHHTSFHGGTIDGMNLVDIIEMVCDWKAAVRRSPDKNLEDTLEYSFDKYGIGDQMQKIIVTTLEDLGWIEPQHQAVNSQNNSNTKEDKNEMS